jgi:protein sidekick
MSNYTFDDLDAFEDYEIRMAYLTNVGQGPWSDVIRQRTLTGRPSVAPPGLHSTAINASAINIWWLAPDNDEINGDLVGFKIRVYGPGVMLEKAVAKEDSDSPAAFSSVIGGLLPDSLYNVTVLCYTAQGDGPESERVSVRTERNGTVISSACLLLHDRALLQPTSVLQFTCASASFPEHSRWMSRP